MVRKIVFISLIGGTILLIYSAGLASPSLEAKLESNEAGQLYMDLAIINPSIFSLSRREIFINDIPVIFEFIGTTVLGKPFTTSHIKIPLSYLEEENIINSSDLLIKGIFKNTLGITHTIKRRVRLNAR